MWFLLREYVCVCVDLRINFKICTVIQPSKVMLKHNFSRPPKTLTQTLFYVHSTTTTNWWSLTKMSERKRKIAADARKKKLIDAKLSRCMRWKGKGERNYETFAVISPFLKLMCGLCVYMLKIFHFLDAEQHLCSCWSRLF